MFGSVFFVICIACLYFQVHKRIAHLLLQLENGEISEDESELDEDNFTIFEDVEFAATSWKDNKQVLLLSTYVGVEPIGHYSRYNKKKTKKERSYTLPESHTRIQCSHGRCGYKGQVLIEFE